MQFLDVTANRHRFGDTGAVIKLEHRHGVLRIHCVERLLELLTLAGIYLNQRDFDGFLRQKHAHPAWVGRKRKIEQSHGVLPIAIAGWRVSRMGYSES